MWIEVAIQMVDLSIEWLPDALKDAEKTVHKLDT